MSIADGYLAEIDAPAVAWERESVAGLLESVRDDPALVRDQHLLHYATHPIVPFAIRFAVGRWPGQDACDDAEWAATAALARRRLSVWREAGIELASGELALGVLDWVDARIGSWNDHDFPSLVRTRVDDLLDAGRRGRERGKRMRKAQGEIPSPECSACWLLRHPGDHYFRRARASASESRLCELLDAQIAVLSDRYDRLSAGHRAHDAADVILELDVLGPIGAGWREPIPTTVRTANTEGLTVGEQVGLRLVDDPDAVFNGMLVSVRAGERWLIVGDGIHDGTIIPRDGSRRIAA